MGDSTKTEREVYELYLLQTYGGGSAEGIINKVNPMGGRVSQYENMIDGVIQKYNLPR